MKRLKAEMWDNMQHIMERYNDHMTHSYLEFCSLLDYEALKKAVAVLVNKIPIFKCRYYKNLFISEWREIPGFTVDNIISLVETDGNAEEISETFLTQKLDERKEAQIKVLVVRCKGRDTLNILKNHMIMDGSDIKLFLSLLAEIYTDIKRGGSGDIDVKNGRRGEEQLYRDFSAKELEETKGLISYSKKQKDKIQFPYEKKGKAGCTPRILRQIVPSDTFFKMKAKCKEKGYTLNDLVVACFYRAMYSITAIPQDQSLAVPCMIDLRKYMNDKQSEGFTNLTSMIVCHIGNDIGGDIFETLEKVKKSLDSLKNDYPGLHGLPLLKNVFRFTPFALAKFLIGTFFKNPLTGISNIGIIPEYSFDGHIPSYLYLTGSIKYSPYIQLALTTYKNEITFTVASYCTPKDIETVKEFYRLIMKEINYFIA